MCVCKKEQNVEIESLLSMSTYIQPIVRGLNNNFCFIGKNQYGKNDNLNNYISEDLVKKGEFYHVYVKLY